MGKELNPPGDISGKMDAALARARERDKESRSLSPAPRGRVPAAGETFELSAVCAVHDRPYVLRYIRQASGRLRFVESLKLQPARAKPREALAGGAAGQMLPLSEFESGEFPCPWCGAQDINGPCDCGALVCGGRKRNGLFRCRDSCGAQWSGVEMREVEAAKDRPVSSARGPAASTPLTRPEASKETRLRLPAPAPARVVGHIGPDKGPKRLK